MTIGGSCLCGGVAFELSKDAISATHCHCARCRKARGTSNATNVLAPLDAVRFVRGEGLLTSYKVPEAKRFAHVFCRVCGASMPRFDPELGFAIIPIGSFDDDPGVRPGRHIFVGSKAVWDTITDDLQQYDGPPPKL